MNEQVAQKLEKFFSQFKRQIYKKGEILIRADDDPPGIFYLTDGYVKEYAISKKGDEIVINVFKPISFFPMSWAINNTQNEYYYEATTPVAVWRAAKEKAIDFIKSNPDVLYDLISRVFSGTDGMTTRMTYLMVGNAYSRLIAELIIQAKRFGQEKESAVTIRISEKDLAAQSGMTRETVSREIKILKDKKLIVHTSNSIVITNLNKLEEELADGV